MSKEDRRYAKRSTRRCYRTMDKSMEYLLCLKGMFDEQHPELAVMLEYMAKAQLAVQTALAKFYAEAWGNVPGDWYSDA